MAFVPIKSCPGTAGAEPGFPGAGSGAGRALLTASAPSGSPGLGTHYRAPCAVPEAEAVDSGVHGQSPAEETAMFDGRGGCRSSGKTRRPEGQRECAGTGGYRADPSLWGRTGPPLP